MRLQNGVCAPPNQPLFRDGPDPIRVRLYAAAHRGLALDGSHHDFEEIAGHVVQLVHLCDIARRLLHEVAIVAGQCGRELRCFPRKFVMDAIESGGRPVIRPDVRLGATRVKSQQILFDGKAIKGF